LVLAMGFGAVHALLPGHGKTIMAGYLVGAGGRRRQAVQVGIAVALMHTASVFCMGLVVLTATTFGGEQLYPWIALASGLVVVAMGVGLFATRSRRRLVPGSSHGHAHAPPDSRPLSRKSLAGLAAAGGILPSPTAVVVLLSTIATHRVAFGLSPIVAFSAGLAAALVAVGLLALRAREIVSRRLHGWAGRWLPAFSAAVIVAVGVFLMARAAVQLRA